MDVEELIVPLSDVAGEEAGPDLSYENERAAIKAPFLLYDGGSDVDEGQWRGAIDAIEEEAAKTRDIELAVLLTRAGAHAGKLEVIEAGAALLAGLMEQLWDQVHPRDPDEGTPDFIGRKSMCDSLTKVRQFLNPLRQTTLFRTERNQFTGEDLLRFASEGASAAGYIPFRQALDTKDADQAEEYRQTFVETVERLDAIRDAIKRADDMLVANADGMTGTNFKDTYDLLDTLRRAVLPYSGAAESEAAADVVGGGSPGTTSGGPALSGGVNSRDDVIRAIDAIVDYYKSREPGSPIPVLMKRAKHWVSMDFLEVLDDLVPESMAAAKQVLVSKLDEPVASETDY